MLGANPKLAMDLLANFEEATNLHLCKIQKQ
jgi:hypothetical protein